MGLQAPGSGGRRASRRSGRQEAAAHASEMLEATGSILLRAQRLRAAMIDSTSTPPSAGAAGAAGAGGSPRASVGEAGWCERFDGGFGANATATATATGGVSNGHGHTSGGK